MMRTEFLFTSKHSKLKMSNIMVNKVNTGTAIICQSLTDEL